MKNLLFVLALSFLLYHCGSDSVTGPVTPPIGNETLLYSFDSVKYTGYIFGAFDSTVINWSDSNSTQRKFHVKYLLISNDSIPGGTTHVHITNSITDNNGNLTDIIHKTCPSLNSSVDTTITLGFNGRYFMTNILMWSHVPNFYLTIKDFKLYKVN